MQIRNTKAIEPSKINCLIIGDSGSGKTFLASTLPGKTLIFSFESGLLSLKGNGIDYIEFDSKNDKTNVAEMGKVLLSDQIAPYDNLYFDSLTAIAESFVALAKTEFPDTRQTLQMFGFLKQKLSSFIRFTRDLNKNVFFTCLPKTTQDELNRRFILPDIPGSLASSIGQYFDFVFYLHMHKKDDQEIRALLTQNKDNILAKDRSGRLDMWEKPDLSLVIKKAFNE